MLASFQILKRKYLNSLNLQIFNNFRNEKCHLNQISRRYISNDSKNDESILPITKNQPDNSIDFKSVGQDINHITQKKSKLKELTYSLIHFVQNEYCTFEIDRIE